jgi:hypothetical protein
MFNDRPAAVIKRMAELEAIDLRDEKGDIRNFIRFFPHVQSFTTGLWHIPPDLSINGNRKIGNRPNCKVELAQERDSLMLAIITKTKTEPGQDLQIDCPNCNRPGAVAKTADVTAREYLFGLVPITTTRWTTVTCGACGRCFRLSKSCSSLATMSQASISGLLESEGITYVSPVVKFCIVLSIVVGILPFFGLGVAIAGIIGSRKARGGWRTAAFVGLVISALATIAGALLMNSQKP